MSDKARDVDPVGRLAALRAPFPPAAISKLPKPTCRADEWRNLPKGKCNTCGGWHATTKTIHLDYVGHAALTARLLDVDPLWTWEPMALDDHGLPRYDENGGLWIKLTVCGHTRLGYGNAAKSNLGDPGNREKEIIGDALRNAAMRFGAALDLWHKGDLPQMDEAPEPPAKHTQRQRAAAAPPPPDAEPFDSVEHAVQAIRHSDSEAEQRLLGPRIAASKFTGTDKKTVTEAWQDQMEIHRESPMADREEVEA